jgi:diguanylate cyclase (GGDEF)-like protein/PAS domain S-box-containing protein
MRAFVTYYRGNDDLTSFVEKNSISNSKSLLIQIFTAHNVEENIRQILSELVELLPDAIIIGSTTDGEIAHGESSRNGTVISFVEFEKATLKYAVDISSDSFQRGERLAKKLKTDNSKLFILLSEGLHTNGENFLKGIESIAPDIKIAGGMAADYANFQKTLVFTKDFILANGAVGVSINSDELEIFNDYNFSWQKIGKKLKITKSEGNIVYEIDGRSAVDTYKHYLGEKVAYKIPSICIEFPLLIEENNTLMARSVIAASGDGSLTFSANMPEGSEVYFGYGNPEEILKHTNVIPSKLKKFEPEIIFVYSCMARLHFVGPMINQELKPLADIAPMSGFFTYGEFFSNEHNRFLNQTMTVLAMREKEVQKTHICEYTSSVDEWNSINALIHLVNKTTQELVEYKSFKEAYKKFERLFEFSGNAIAVIHNNRFVECNQKLLQLLGYKQKEEFLKTNIIDIIDDEYKDKFKSILANIDNDVKSDIQEYHQEIKIKLKDGKTIWVEITLTATIEDEHIYIIYRDINQRKEAENKLFYKAYHDDLTGLPNRKYFMEKLQEQISQIKNSDEKVAVLFVDLDKLKLVNDTLGHDIGDVMIQTVASRLQQIVAKNGIVARLGGDEFMVMLTNLTSKEDAGVISKKILNLVQKPISLDMHTFYSSASIGIAIYPDDTTDRTSLLKFSDTAMYKAKEDGGNRYAFYESNMTQQSIEKLEMQEAFINALRKREFEIVYLPQYDMKHNSIKSVEALIRWNHPTKGLLTPDEFLPYIEKLNLLYRLDKWLMNSAIKEFMHWDKLGIAPEKLSLNIRIAELANEQWERKVIKTLKRLSFDSSRLELEISERDIMKHPQRVLSLLKSLHNNGIDIVIDDFGTGYSSLKQLRELPLSKIKIDKSYIVDMTNDKDALNMSNIIISLANALGVDIIAEGVETNEQVELLLKNGCRYAQGYYYGKPMNKDNIIDILRSQNS